MKIETLKIKSLFLLAVILLTTSIYGQSAPEIPPDSIPSDREITEGLDGEELVEFIQTTCGYGCHSSTAEMFGEVIEENYDRSPGASYPSADGGPFGGGAAVLTDNDDDRHLCFSESGDGDCIEYGGGEGNPFEVPELPEGGDGLEPGDFLPLYLQARDSVTAGYSLSVDSEIKNVGGEDRERTVELWVEGEGVVDSTNLDLNADQSKSVSFEWNTDTGDKLIEVRADYNVNDGTPSMN